MSAPRPAPRVSVIIPCYNKARFLRESIDSVLAQDFRDFELILADNMSSDESWDICRSYDDPRIQTLQCRTPGQAATSNECLRIARGEFAMLHCDDDVLLPQFLSRAVATLGAFPAAGAVSCAVQHIDEDGVRLKIQAAHHTRDIVPGREMLERLICDGCTLSVAGVLVRRKIYDTVGGYTNLATWGIDWHFWMRAALLGDFAFIPDILALYRDHDNNLTKSVIQTARNCADERRLIEDILTRMPSGDLDRSHLQRVALRNLAHRTWCIAEECSIAGDGATTRRQLSAAAKVYPLMLFQPRFHGLWAASLTGHSLFTLLCDLRALLCRESPVDRTTNH